MQLLLIEDEPRIAAFIHKGLAESGHTVTVSYDGKSGLAMAQQQDFDVLIIDLMLPYLNGLEICSMLRQKMIDTPVLMLTALGSVEDKIEGFHRGADDYLVKPFHFGELMVRLQALAKRRALKPIENKLLAYADVALDTDSKTAMRNNRTISLTVKEFNLLELFMRNAGRVLSRSIIAERVWGYEFDPASNMIDVYVNYLRKKLEQSGEPRLIHTLSGFGYMLKEQ